MFRGWLCLPVFLAVLSVFGGCQRAVPPSFSPGEEVLKLTADLEDGDEKKVYQQLQSQIAAVLRQHVGTPDKPKMLGETDIDDAHLKRGYRLYSRFCVQCHGVNGNGEGAVAKYLNPKPRNYTHGIFKFTSTPYGKKPRRSDLIYTLRRGVPGTSMPAFDRFSEEDLGAVVDYVLVLTHRGELERTLAMIAYDDEEVPVEEDLQEVIQSILEPWRESSNELVMPSVMPPPMTDESVRAGHRIFLEQACNKCHGKFGRGGSLGNVEVGVDAWGNKTAAADLSSGMFRGGGRPLDIWRRIHSGINGTPMPAFAGIFQDNPDAIWQLVHFIAQTGNRRRMGEPPLSEADLPTEAPAPPAAASEAKSPQEAVEAEEAKQEEPKEQSTIDTVLEDDPSAAESETSETEESVPEEPAEEAAPAEAANEAG